MSFSFNVNLPNFAGIQVQVALAMKFGQFVLDQQVIKDGNYFVPMDQHFLEKSAILNSKVGEGRIVWQTKYARRLYYNPQYNFSKDVNSNARGLWFEAAKSMYKNEWLTATELAVKSKL